MARFSLAALLSVAAFSATSASASTGSCPPANFQTKQNFSPQDYFTKKWYGVAQQPVKNQEEDLLNCITATYQIEGETVKVYNTARRGGVNGPLVDVNLVAKTPDAAVPSKAVVGFPGFPFADSLYWVVEAGSFGDLLNGKTTFEGTQYDWALVSAGAPEVDTGAGCVPGVGTKNNTQGFWLLSSKPLLSAEESSKLADLVKAKGFDRSYLLPVAHEGCKYE